MVCGSIKNFTKYLVSVSMALMFTTAVFADDNDAEEAVENVEAVEEATAGGQYADFLEQVPFRDGVFKNPAYEEVNAKFPLSFKLLMGLDGKVNSNFYAFRQHYMAAEQRLADGSTEDADLDMFRMAYAYEMLSCIGDLYVSKGKVSTASDETIDNGVLKAIVSEKVQAAPAELWKFLLFANATYLPKDNTIKNRVAFANKILATGSPLPVALARMGLVEKVFNGYREGKYKDKKVK
jgi:hypothetical protein